MSSPPNGQKQSGLSKDEPGLIWDEYKYRHQHCWNTIYKLTSAAVLLGVVPYLNAKLPQGLGYWLLSPPALAIALIAFAMLRMRRELLRLDQFKSRHRKHQQDLYGWPNESPGHFNKHVWGYLGILLVLATANVVIATIHLAAIHLGP